MRKSFKDVEDVFKCCQIVIRKILNISGLRTKGATIT